MNTCKQHGWPEPCSLCSVSVTLGKIMAQELGGTQPRYRFWRVPRSAGHSEYTYEWTTERADGGKFWAIERRWVRARNGERGKIIRRAGFAQRQKAKDRARQWYEKARST